MKRFLTVLASAAALCVPAAALAADATPTAAQLAAQQCKTLRTTSPSTFTSLYSSLGKCVSKAMRSAQAEVQNASEQCQAESTDANFAAGHDGKTFAQFYGNAKGKNADANAMGKCVSAKAHAAADARAAALLKAAKSCKAARTADTAGFAKQYSSLGACVSAKTKSA